MVMAQDFSLTSSHMYTYICSNLKQILLYKTVTGPEKVLPATYIHVKFECIDFQM